METVFDAAVAILIGLWPVITGTDAHVDSVVEAFEKSELDYSEEEVRQAWSNLQESGMLEEVQ